MRAQIVLTPVESKKLIAKAVSEAEWFKRAFQEGIVAIHPSSTTYFIMEYLTGKKPDGIWLVGMVSPKGTCVEGIIHQEMERGKYQDLKDPANFPFSWVFRKGKFEDKVKLGDILSQMGENDVYVKGVNAIDPFGYVGVLLGSLSGGTIGKVMAIQKCNKFRVIFVGGIEKFIPSPIQSVAVETGRDKTSDALGYPCGLFPIKAQAFTETEALKVLTDVEAIPIAAGGVAGAEGSVLMVMKGAEQNVTKAMEVVKNLKGAQLPEIHIPDCKSCHFPGCHLSGMDIPW